MKNLKLSGWWLTTSREEEDKKMGVKDTFIYEECMKELNATFKKELNECSEKGVEISQECKSFYKNKFEGVIDHIDDNTDGGKNDV